MNLPQSTKYTVDGIAGSVAIAHMLGWWKDNVGTLAATAGFIWILIQIYFYLKDRRKKGQK